MKEQVHARIRPLSVDAKNIKPRTLVLSHGYVRLEARAVMKIERAQKLLALIQRI